ncbi:MAG: hypothetical protein Q9204_004750 [Flavoplaca sp. TL-2023a]
MHATAAAVHIAIMVWLASLASASLTPLASMTITNTLLPPSTTTSQPPSTIHLASLLPHGGGDGIMVTDGLLDHWRPPFDVGGLTTHTVYYTTGRPQHRTPLSPNCPGYEYCLYNESGVPQTGRYRGDSSDYPNLAIRTSTRMLHRPKDSWVRTENVVVHTGTGLPGVVTRLMTHHTIPVRKEWAFDERGSVTWKNVYDGSMKYAVEEWMERYRPTGLQSQVEMWRTAKGRTAREDPTTVTAISDAVEMWKERGRQLTWHTWDGKTTLVKVVRRVVETRTTIERRVEDEPRLTAWVVVGEEDGNPTLTTSDKRDAGGNWDVGGKPALSMRSVHGGQKRPTMTTTKKMDLDGKGELEVKPAITVRGIVYENEMEPVVTTTAYKPEEKDAVETSARWSQVASLSIRGYWEWAR